MDTKLDRMKLMDTFFIECDSLFMELEAAGDAVNADEITSDVIDNAFRAAHSIKSESAYLGLEETERISHQLENRLDEMKEQLSRAEAAEPGSGKAFTERLTELKRALEREKSRHNSMPEAVGGAQGDTGDTSERASIFTPLEKQLIREASERGERFFRLYCEIDKSEKMVYPRLFLLVNNLELELNVIKTIPELSDSEDPDNEIQIYFSTRFDEDHIYKLVSVDQVSQIHLTRLQPKEMLELGPLPLVRTEVKEESQSGASLLRVDPGKFDRLKSGIEEIEHYARKLEQLNRVALTEELEVQRKLVELSDRVGRILQKIYLVPVCSEIRRLKQYGDELAAKTEKKVEVSVRCDDFEIDTRYLDTVSDVLVHLVRNSIDHGIEAEEERVLQEKEPAGTVVICAEKSEKEVFFQVIDDGRGMDPDQLLKRAKQKGKSMVHDKDVSLLDIIALPGFSTKENVSSSSGRGYGLDISVRRLQSIPESDMRVVSVPGKGTVFSILLPSGHTNIPVIIVRCGNLQIAVPKSAIRNQEQVNTALFSKEKNGSLLYRETPVYRIRGRVTGLTGSPEESHALLISYNNSLGYFLYNELLFDKEIFERQIIRDEQPEPHTHPIRQGSASADYLYLDPALIDRGD